MVSRRVVEPDGRATTTVRFRTRKARALAREGTTWSVDIPGRVGPVGRLLRRTGLDRLPEVLAGLVAPGAAPAARRRRGGGSAAAPGADQAQVDAGQLTR